MFPLTTLQLKKPEPLVPKESLVERVSALGHISTFAVELDVSERIGDLFQDQPELGLHIVVHLVPSRECSFVYQAAVSTDSADYNFLATISPSSSAHKHSLDDDGSHERKGKKHKAGERVLCQLIILTLIIYIHRFNCGCQRLGWPILLEVWYIF